MPKLYWPKNMINKSFQKYLVSGKTVDFLLKKSQFYLVLKTGSITKKVF